MAPEPLYVVNRDVDWSDRTWIAEYGYNSRSEGLTAYNPGGLCPVLLEDVLSGPDLLRGGEMCSFEIVGKLGAGSFSTVWVAKNSKSKSFYALKILTHECSTRENSEMRILDKLEKLNYAFFYTHKPTGREFLCLAMEPMGCSLSSARTAGWDLLVDIPSITAFLKALITRLLDLHAQGIQHGDISPPNVALPAHGNAFTNEELKATFGDDLISNVELGIRFQGRDPSTLPQLPPNLPKYIVLHTLPLCTDISDMSLVDFMDFGDAFDTPSKKGVSGTRGYMAPEVEYGSKPVATARSDLWSLGCVIVYALSGTDLFHVFHQSRHYIDSDAETQWSSIDTTLQNNHHLLEHNPKYRYIVTQIVYVLLRPDPMERDPSRVKKLLKELEQCGNEAKYPDLEKLNLD